MKTTTYYLVEVQHSDPLPTKTDMTDVIAQRTYNYLYAQGVQVGVNVSVILPDEDGEDGAE